MGSYRVGLMEPAIDIPTASNIFTSNFESPPFYFIQTNLNLKHENRHLDNHVSSWTLKLEHQLKSPVYFCHGVNIQIW